MNVNPLKHIWWLPQPCYRLSLLMLPGLVLLQQCYYTTSAVAISSRHQLPHVPLPKAVTPVLAIHLVELNFRLTSGRKIVISPKEAKDRKILQCNSKIKSSSWRKQKIRYLLSLKNCQGEVENY